MAAIAPCVQQVPPSCDFTEVKNVTYHLRGAKGGEHRGETIDNWAQVTVDADGELVPRARAGFAALATQVRRWADGA